VPRICFINKMDRVGADLDYFIQTIKERWEQTRFRCRLRSEKNPISRVRLIFWK
jgi:translation elongation factor EF-G